MYIYIYAQALQSYISLWNIASKLSGDLNPHHPPPAADNPNNPNHSDNRDQDRTEMRGNDDPNNPDNPLMTL